MNKLCSILFLAIAGCQSQQVVQFNTEILDTRGPVSIQVDSFGGDVTIIVDPTVVGTVVTANQLEVGQNGLPERNAQMRCATQIESGILGEVVHVSATAIDNPLDLISAEIIVKASSVHGVRVHTSDGNVSLLGISGPIDVQTNDGDVRVVTSLVMNEMVSIENRHGNIVYRVSGDSSGKIDATAINGEVAFDLRQGDATILPNSTGDRLVADLNDGTNTLNMRTVDGDVRIYVLDNPAGSEPFFNTDWVSW
jgi:hypothetical protein